MKTFIFNLWVKKIEVRISNLPQEEKIDYLARMLFKEMDRAYVLNSRVEALKNFEIQEFESQKGFIHVGGVCEDFDRKIKIDEVRR